jgi:Rrf2 family protein
MKLSAHEEYGLRCLVQIGKHGAEGSLTIPEISRAEGISPPYVAKLMRILRRGGFVKSVRGKAGGYTLSRPSEEIVVGEVLALLGGRFYQTGFCEGHSGREETCAHTTDCAVRSLWRAVQVAMDQVLSGTTLKDLLVRTEREMTSWVTLSKLRPGPKQLNVQ